MHPGRWQPWIRNIVGTGLARSRRCTQPYCSYSLRKRGLASPLVAGLEAEGFSVRLVELTTGLLEGSVPAEGI